MPNLTLCTAQDIKDRIGDALFLQLVDDDQSGSQSGTTEGRADTVAIRRASNEVEAFLERYDLTTVDVSVYTTYVGIVRDLSADLAAEYLCKRRNLPQEEMDAIVKDAAEARRKLKMMKDSLMNIPGLAPRGRGAPIVSNPGVSQRGGIAVPVVQPATSPQNPQPDHLQFRSRSTRWPGT